MANKLLFRPMSFFSDRQWYFFLTVDAVSRVEVLLL